MVKELEQAKEPGKEELLPHDQKAIVDSINHLICQADTIKLEWIYNFIVNIL